MIIMEIVTDILSDPIPFYHLTWMFYRGTNLSGVSLDFYIAQTDSNSNCYRWFLLFMGLGPSVRGSEKILLCSRKYVPVVPR